MKCSWLISPVVSDISEKASIGLRAKPPIEPRNINVSSFNSKNYIDLRLHMILNHFIEDYRQSFSLYLSSYELSFCDFQEPDIDKNSLEYYFYKNGYCRLIDFFSNKFFSISDINDVIQVGQILDYARMKLAFCFEDDDDLDLIFIASVDCLIREFNSFGFTNLSNSGHGNMIGSVIMFSKQYRNNSCVENNYGVSA